MQNVAKYFTQKIVHSESYCIAIKWIKSEQKITTIMTATNNSNNNEFSDIQNQNILTDEN